MPCCRSDTLGHILPTLGKDWTHQGIASLYHKVSLWVWAAERKSDQTLFTVEDSRPGLCFSLTGMDTSSCTAPRGPSAWRIWPEATCTGSTSRELCCRWARCCSAPAASSLPFTGQTPLKHSHHEKALNKKVQLVWHLTCNVYVGKWLRKNQRSSRSSVSRT